VVADASHFYAVPLERVTDEANPLERIVFSMTRGSSRAVQPPGLFSFSLTELLIGRRV
jgi:hypothetical protein